MPDEVARRKAGSSQLRQLLRRSAQRAERHEMRELTDSQEQAAPTSAPAAPPRRPAWASMLRDFVRPNRSQAIIAGVLFLTSLLVVMGVKAGNADTDFSTMRRADLIAMLDTIGAENRRLDSEITQLQRTKEQLLSGAGSAQVAAEEAKRRLGTLQILAGTTPAQGPGIRITIQDPAGKFTPELLLDAVEEMRDAGAEAIAINGRIRVVASSWFGRSATGDLLADGVVVTTPVVLEIIGQPATLEAGARFRGGLVSEVQGDRVGGSVTIEQLPTVTIRALATPVIPQFSKPA